MRLLLEAYYEPTFSGRSYGFRPGQGCHTALTDVAISWTGTTWFIEGDISDCFGSFDHEIMVSILAEKIHDNRFLRLIKQMLRAGYLEDWEWNETLSGCPQGGLCSATHNPPYAQYRIMRSAGLPGLVGAGSASGTEHNAEDPFMRPGRGWAAHDRRSAGGRLACAGVWPGSGDDPPGLQGLDDGLVPGLRWRKRRAASPCSHATGPRSSSTLLSRGEGGGQAVEGDGLAAQGAGAEDDGEHDLQFAQGLVEGHPGAGTFGSCLSMVQKA